MSEAVRTHVTRLELFRRTRGWSQEQLAAFLGPGFSAATISLIECQRLKPSARQRERLEEIFGTGADTMLQPIDPSGFGLELAP